MFNIKVDTSQLTNAFSVRLPALLDRLVPSTSSALVPLVKNAVHNDLEATFKTQGANIGKTWKKLSFTTELKRVMAGLPEAPPLYRSGNIYRNISPGENGWSTSSSNKRLTLKLRRSAKANMSHPFNKSTADLIMVHAEGNPRLPKRPVFDINGYGVSVQSTYRIQAMVLRHVQQVCSGGF